MRNLAIVATAFLGVCGVLALGSTAYAQSQPNPEQRVALIAKQSVVRVVGAYTATFELGGKELELSIGGTGSGFFLTGDGYIVTNAHVVDTIHDGDSAARIALRAELRSYIRQQIPDISSSQLDRFLYDVELTKLSAKSYVVLPNGDQLEYTIAAYGVPGGGSDAAVLKVATDNAPNLPLADSTRSQVADHIVVLGYPGVADLTGLLDEKSQLEASLTSGSIGAIKRAQSGEPILQISAPITHGNSGGPALDESGAVVGLATFGNNDDVQGFNFLVASETVKHLIDSAKLKPVPSDTSKLWLVGLTQFWDRHYTDAIATFKDVARMYPAHGGTADLIRQAETLRGEGKEVPIETPSSPSSSSSTLPIIVSLALGGSGLLLLLFWLRRGKSTPLIAAQPAMPGASGIASLYVGAPMANAPGPQPQYPAPPVLPAAYSMPSAPPASASGHAPVAPTAFGNFAIGSLECIRGQLMGQRFALTAQGLLIGRQPGVAQIVVSDSRASSRHVWIGFAEGRLICVDHSTVNGTFVNDVARGRVSRAELRDGDVVIVVDPDVLCMRVRLSG